MTNKKQLLKTAKQLRHVYANKAVASNGCPNIETKHEILKRRLEILDLAHNVEDDQKKINDLNKKFKQELHELQTGKREKHYA